MGELSEPTHEPQRPFTYDYPEDGIFSITSPCAIGCTKQPHDDDCQVPHYDQVLEALYLDNQLGIANEMAHSVGLQSVEASPYILDIDLDYFHSENAVSPDDSSSFHRLIRNTAAITIALEPGCVEDLKIEGSSITSETLLNSILEHIYQSTL